MRWRVVFECGSREVEGTYVFDAPKEAESMFPHLETYLIRVGFVPRGTRLLEFFRLHRVTIAVDEQGWIRLRFDCSPTATTYRGRRLVEKDRSKKNVLGLGGLLATGVILWSWPKLVELVSRGPALREKQEAHRQFNDVQQEVEVAGALHADLGRLHQAISESLSRSAEPTCPTQPEVFLPDWHLVQSGEVQLDELRTQVDEQLQRTKNKAAEDSAEAKDARRWEGFLHELDTKIAAAKEEVKKTWLAVQDLRKQQDEAARAWSARCDEINVPLPDADVNLPPLPSLPAATSIEQLLRDTDTRSNAARGLDWLKVRADYAQVLQAISRWKQEVASLDLQRRIANAKASKLLADNLAREVERRKQLCRDLVLSREQIHSMQAQAKMQMTGLQKRMTALVQKMSGGADKVRSRIECEFARRAVTDFRRSLRIFRDVVRRLKELQIREVEDFVRRTEPLNSMPDEDPSPALSCDALSAERAREEALAREQDAMRKVTNYFEDHVRPPVRVCVKFNALPEQPDPAAPPGVRVEQDAKGPLLVVRRKDREPWKFGPFDSVYTAADTAESMFNQPKTKSGQPLQPVFEQLSSGYSNVLLAIGPSGSGKSFTLFGKFNAADEMRESEGLLHLALKDKTWSLNFVCELYGSMHFEYKDLPETLFHAAGTHGCSGAYVPLVETTLHVYYGMADFETASFTFVKADRFETPTSIADLLLKIHEKQKAHSTIKATPNNPESSRGHLFINFKVGTSGRSSFLTVVDLGGSENSVEMEKKMFQPLRSGKETDIRVRRVLLFTKAGESDAERNARVQRLTEDRIVNDGALAGWAHHAFKSSNNASQLMYAQDLFREGAFINESLNHLAFYLTAEVTKQGTAEQKLAEPNDFCNADLETSFYDPRTQAAAVCIIPMLKHIVALGAADKPSKFILFTLLRTSNQEPYSTLSVAQRFVSARRRQ